MALRNEDSLDPTRTSRGRVIAVSALAAVAVAVVVVFAVRSANTEAGNDAGAGTVTAGDPATSTSASPSYMSRVPVTAESRVSQTPVPLDAPAALPGGAVLKITSIEPVEGEAMVPGEVGGPALRITVELSNSSQEAIDSSMVVTNLYYGPDQLPAGTLMSSGAQAFPPVVEPGETATGVVVFTVPLAERAQIKIEVDLSVDRPVVMFQGALG